VSELGTHPDHAIHRTLWALASDAKRAALVAEWTRDMQRPGRPGVMAAAQACLFLPGLIRTAFHLASREAFATALLSLWIGGAIRVTALAEHAETLSRWFARARLTEPPPFLAPLVLDRSELPDRILLYRGGTLAASEPGVGRSWTQHRTTAAYYARRRQDQHGGRPVILQAEVTAEQLGLVTRTRESEWVTPCPVHAEVDTKDKRTISRLARRAEAYMLQPIAQEFLRLRLDCDKNWHGWPGK
jgi:hypothetical protein